MPETLRTLPQKLDADQRAEYRSQADHRAISLTRLRGSPPTVDPLDSLMAALRARSRQPDWEDRTLSDRWLAPRVHYSLRLYRAEAADRGLWQWLALRYSWYVEWRWAGQDGQIADDRWWGPIHKQAFARLWWGAEMFRDGSDYRTVQQAFVFQDLPNSYLHRPIVRCRSLALAVVDRIAMSENSSSEQVNGLARALNLATVGAPPEVETDYQTDDINAYDEWCRSVPTPPDDWAPLPVGPRAVDTTESSRQGGARVVSRGWRYAALD
ncbi:DUF6339 family protein [Mycolicibacterium sp. OfavD-34-C]|uniref:DUF6339 family protein n=1 Tax=Mycolicibacterium sp. OfavD-34-C TaxID=2917746 RepID=UPI0035ABA604